MSSESVRAVVLDVPDPFADRPDFQAPRGKREVVRESLAHLRRYLGLIFNQPRNTKRKDKP
jgi:hypothetical protein